jgi:EmrB/QacA subfamily drug resistance transporter
MSTHRPLVMLAVVLAMLLAAIEATIVATAMPSIAEALGGFELYGWVFSSYLLMQAVMTPIFGKLADLYGRKPVFQMGVGTFLLGSLLCGLAPSMSWLVFFRLLQGIGAGAVVPIAVTLAGDLYSLQERGRVQAYMSSVWGVSSIMGPLAGGLIVSHMGWRWIFWLNLPIGLLAMALLARYLHEQLEPRRVELDLPGAAYLLISLTALLLAMSWGGWGGLGLLLLAALTGALFVRQEYRAPDPVVHLELWTNPLVMRGNVAVLLLGVGMLGLIAFLPTYVQGVLGESALVAGFAVSTMCVGWPLAAVVTGRLLLRMEVRPLVRCGGVLATLGALMIALTARYGAVWAGLGSLVVGVGFGILNTGFLVAIQTMVGWEKRGMATAGTMLMRNLGNAMGTAALGALLNYRLGQHLQSKGLHGEVSVADLLRESSLPPETLAHMQTGLHDALSLVFWVVFGAVLAAAVAAWGAPRLRLSDGSSQNGQNLVTEP